MASRIWQAWLPENLAAKAQNEEPVRFAALSKCVCAEVDSALKDEADPNRWHRLVKWLSLVHTFNNLHHDVPAEHVVPLAEALWRSVAESWMDLEAQVRVTECLTKLLRAHKRTLRRARLVLPWRPVFSTMLRLHGLPLPKLEGLRLISARSTALTKLVSKARRYFEPWALGEVWRELRPAILAVRRRPNEGYEALGYLQLFAPTHNICRCQWSAVNGWLREWFAAWDGCANSPSWDSLWLGVLSRAAKHDWRGVIDWRPYLPHIFSSLMDLFDVPIGSSRGAKEVLTRAAPGRANILFMSQMGYGSFHAARLVVHLLRCTADPQRGTLTAASASATAAHLEHFTSLIEQYYHPSNTGKWCRELGTLLKHLVKATVKQLERQQPPPTVQPTPTDASDTKLAEELEFEFEYMDMESDVDAIANADASGHRSGSGGECVIGSGAYGGNPGGADGPAAMAAAGAAAASSRLWVSELREAELQRLAACCVTLAARGQFSKDSSITNVSVKALSQLAMITPGRVLPLVLERFRTAIATATATHQLVAATVTLALCVRPLLLTGWVSGGEGEEQETAAQLISEALMAALPGLDANDEPKTNAVLQLFVSVISALPRLRGAGEEDESDDVAAREEEEEHGFARAVQPPGDGGGDTATTAASSMTVDVSLDGGSELTLSLYVAEWADEVLERCLALLQNLDSGPGHRGVDMAARGGSTSTSTSSFLTGPRSMFSTLWLLLLHYTRPSVRRRIVQRLATFILGGTVPGVATEVAIIASHAASAAPRETLRSLLLPLLLRVEAEVQELPRLPPAAATATAAAPPPPPPPPSAGREATLSYHLTILIEMVNQFHVEALLVPRLEDKLGRAEATGGGGDVSSFDVPASVPRAGSLMSRLLLLSDQLLAVNSTGLQGDGATLGGIVVMALSRYWLEPHLPWRRPMGQPRMAPLVSGRGVELWVDKFGSGYEKPRWWSPSATCLALGGPLLQQRLLAPAQRLRALVAGDGGTRGGWGGDSCTRIRVRSELLRVRSMLHHSLSMLRDFQFGSGSRGGNPEDAGVPLTVFGQLGVMVSEAGVREQLAEALVEVCSALRSSGDPELLALAARCGGVLLAAGSVEYVTSQGDERTQRATLHLFSDPPAASRLVPGVAWRRRSPMWMVHARLFTTLTSRASAAAFRSWASTRQPEVTSLDQFPVAYLALLRTQCLLAQHPNKDLAQGAASAVEVATKRFPCLVPAFLPYFLAALADVPYDWFPLAAQPLPSLLTEFFSRVRYVAFGRDNGGAAVTTGAVGDDDAAAVAAAAACTAPPSPMSEIERDGKVEGACHTIKSTLNFWRLITRSPDWLAATLATMLAARVHNASVPQKAVTNLVLSFATRFVHPPAMSYSSEEYGDLVRALLDVARPGVMSRRGAPFRYTIIANVLLTLLLPHRYGPPPAEALVGNGYGCSDFGGPGGAGLEISASLLRHMMDLLVGTDAPQLRQLGMSGIFLPLCAVEEYGAPLPQLVDVLRKIIKDAAELQAVLTVPAADGVSAAGAAAAVSAPGSGGGWGSRLLHALVLSHTELDYMEATKDKRGAGALVLRLLNMTFEEAAGRVASLQLDRLSRWPNDGLTQPAAVTEGAFVVQHARLVQLLAAAAPEEMLSALSGPLEALTATDRLTTAGDGTDKAEMATAAEVLAGLLASGAPWVASAAASTEGGTTSLGGGWVLAALARAVRGTSLDMSESWALSYRYAVRGLLDGLFPERLHSVAPPGPGRGSPPQPPLAAGLTAGMLISSLSDLLSVIMHSPPGSPPAVATETATALATEMDIDAVGSSDGPSGSGGDSGGFPARIKRLRCVGAVVRELAGLDPAKELPPPVLQFWRGLLEELHAATASLDCLSLREALGGPLTDTLGYFGAAEGLLQALSRQQQRSGGGGGGGGEGGGGGVGRPLCAGVYRNGNSIGNGSAAGASGSNGEADLIHISADPSGVSTPAEVEMELGSGGGGGETNAVLLMLPDSAPAPQYHESLRELRSRARSLAQGLAARFNEAATQVQAARAAEAALTLAAPSQPTTATRPSAGSGSAGGAPPVANESLFSGTADDNVVLVNAVDVASASASMSSQRQIPAPDGSAAAAGTTPSVTTTTGAVPMDAEGGGAGGGAAHVVTPTGSAAVAHLGLGSEVQLDAAARHRAPELRELVVGMLPGLLLLQDVSGPELQKFSREFQATLLLVRCLSLSTYSDAFSTTASSGGAAGGGAAMLAAALDVLCAAAVVEVPWTSRAAALSYAQTLWFRHAPLLSPAQLRRLQGIVVARLQDSKAEVRSLAAATLSGLLRGTPAEDVDVLRNQFLEKATTLFGSRSRRQRRRGDVASIAGDGGSASVTAAAAAAAVRSPQQLQLEKLGCVAGLSALLMSCPYDVPTWLPPVLMALVHAAGGGEQDGTVRSKAGRALGEFRRTHEVEALEELRGRMDPDDWDSFTQATGSASYFV